jgi:Dolichyl-phosphate-mannose-protein mannosyltransferase
MRATDSTALLLHLDKRNMEGTVRLNEAPVLKPPRSGERRDATKRPARAYFLLAALTVLCLLPFSGRAFHTDDTLFIWAARNIVKHPFNPYGFQLNWEFTQVRMSELTQNPPLASYYMALAGSVVGWSERALHLTFLLPTLALALGTYRLAQKFTRSPLLVAFATLLTPGLLVSACSVMCDPMMLAIWMWAAILWIEGLEPQRPLFLAASALLIVASELTKYFGACLILLLFIYSIARQKRVGSWVWYLLIPVTALVGYEFLTAKMYGHGLLFTAADFSRKRRLYDHATRTARGLVALSYAGGCALPALVFAPIVWSRRQIMLGMLWSGVASYLMMHGRVHLGVPVGGYMASAMRHHHWLLISSHLILFIAGGTSVLALAVADYWHERDAASLFLALWVLGTFVFTAFLNWTINARSVLPLIPATAILLTRRLERIREAPTWRWTASIVAALLLSGFVSLWITRADTELANSARSAAFAIYERTHGKGGTVWFIGHWGFQYYMESLGARPLDWLNPQVNNGDFVAVPYNNLWPSDRSDDFLGPKEQFGVQLHSHASTICPELGAGFYYSHWALIPYVIGPIPGGHYSIVRLEPY